MSVEAQRTRQCFGILGDICNNGGAAGKCSFLTMGVAAATALGAASADDKTVKVALGIISGVSFMLTFGLCCVAGGNMRDDSGYQRV